MKKEFQRKRISYQVVVRERDTDGVDIQRKVFYKINGKWERSASMTFQVSAHNGVVYAVYWLLHGVPNEEASYDLFTEFANRYNDIMSWAEQTDDQGTFTVEMDAEDSIWM